VTIHLHSAYSASENADQPYTQPIVTKALRARPGPRSNTTHDRKDPILWIRVQGSENSTPSNSHGNTTASRSTIPVLTLFKHVTSLVQSNFSEPQFLLPNIGCIQNRHIIPILTIWSSVTRPTKNSLLYQGDCNCSKRLDTGMHVLINVFSTVLLSGSNYCMQCMSATTREEVDTTHANKKRLNISILSLQSLRHFHRQKLLLWFLLALKSLPLHLL
jgi:hypothetical protein